MDIIHALQILRAKGFTGPIEISTSMSDNATVDSEGYPAYDSEHAQRHSSAVRIYDQGIVEKGERLEDVIHRQVLKQHD